MVFFQVQNGTLTVALIFKFLILILNIQVFTSHYFRINIENWREGDIEYQHIKYCFIKPKNEETRRNFLLKVDLIDRFHRFFEGVNIYIVSLIYHYLLFMINA